MSVSSIEQGELGRGFPYEDVDWSRVRKAQVHHSVVRRVAKWIEATGMVQPRQPVLCAVSGGVDSVVLVWILRLLDFPCGIAHMNFQLRGVASEADADFVWLFARRMGLPFYSKRVDARSYARRRGLSLEVACRELRYAWLEAIRRREGYHVVATAHHATDLVETVLLNLVRGTGLAGLRGIPPVRDRVIRPLLPLSRREIEAFARTCGLAWREDLSNWDVAIPRNWVRHCVVPLMRRLNPSLEEAFFSVAWVVRDAEVLVGDALRMWRKKVMIRRGEEVWIPFRRVRGHPAYRSLFYHLLEPFHFTRSQVDQIIEVLDSQPGKQFFSMTHRLIVDRSHLILTPLYAIPDRATIHLIEHVGSDPVRVQTGEGTLTLQVVDPGSVLIEDNPNIAYIKYNKLKFPLVLRRWRPGDYFYPLGLRKKKKLKKFFTDLKFSLADKEKVWILEEGKRRIVWIVGIRMDDRFRITRKSTKILVARWEPASHYPRVQKGTNTM